jgi:xanthine dehydrogenase small subunit
MIRFLLDGDLIELADADPTATLLDHLRYTLRRTGTKEGCAEGDCGACTVLLGELAVDNPHPRHSREGGNPSPALSEGTGGASGSDLAAPSGPAAPSRQTPAHEMDPHLRGDDEDGGDGAGEREKVQWRAVNACITFLPMLHGKALMTVESLARDGRLNPLQACMAANGSSQCGFCTPGFVMSLHGRAIGASGCDLPVEDVIAGNLCRCTGYGPILEAGAAIPRLGQDDAALVSALEGIEDETSGEVGGRRWFAPRTRARLADLLAAYPDARLVAGATDVGLWVTKGLRTLDTVIFVGDVTDLRLIAETAEGVTLGAAVTYAQAHAALARLHPDLGELVRRLGGLQVRNAGTVGGNIANGSPIGDGPPALIALGATLTLSSIEGRRTMPLEDYFLDYGRQDRRPGEFVESVFIPRPRSDAVIHIAKLSRRFDSDISAVCGAVHLTVREGTITAARMAFGGMAATPRRAKACEAALSGQPFSQATLEAAAEVLREDFTPLTDVRGSAAYRLEAAANLLRRLWAREQGQTISVLELEADG